ncbi:hypothetical protein MATL_G00171210 [Megalops atlanticus]|uniref:Uncharacterized protein n=1 Tax=Megalops atlanticus TaxID=7932 RepID=A0A9D3PR68_MEGAT|nr:hypothetical protein MATL_G00171210 [Megalops atlanticus]
MSVICNVLCSLGESGRNVTACVYVELGKTQNKEELRGAKDAQADVLKLLAAGTAYRTQRKRRGGRTQEAGKASPKGCLSNQGWKDVIEG